MPRTVEITLPAVRTQEMVEAISQIKGLISLRVQKDVSLKPPGDVVSLEISNNDFKGLMLLFNDRGLLNDPGVSLTTNQPSSIIAASSSHLVMTDTSETNWEEMQTTLNKESNMTLNSMLNMFLAGVLAAIGIITNSLHIVVGAMVIAPGFEPITRISLGLVSQCSDWKNGALDTLKGYIALFIGGFMGAMAMKMLGKDLLASEGAYLPSGTLISYWTKISATSVIIAVVAAVAGAIVIITNRSVLTAGVMIALALIPSTAIMSIGLITDNLSIVEKALTRLTLEMSLVAVASAVVFFWKKQTVHKRKMSL